MSYVRETLSDDERVIYKADIHWALHIKPALAAAFATLVFGGSIDGGVHPLSALVCFLFWMPLVSSIISRMTTELVITDKRVIFKTGFITRHIAEPLLQQVEGVNLEQSVLGRALNYGDVDIKGTGGGFAPIRCVVDPIAFKDALLPLIR